MNFDEAIMYLQKYNDPASNQHLLGLYFPIIEKALNGSDATEAANIEKNLKKLFSVNNVINQLINRVKEQKNGLQYLTTHFPYLFLYNNACNNLSSKKLQKILNSLENKKMKMITYKNSKLFPNNKEFNKDSFKAIINIALHPPLITPQERSSLLQLILSEPSEVTANLAIKKVNFALFGVGVDSFQNARTKKVTELAKRITELVKYFPEFENALRDQSSTNFDAKVASLIPVNGVINKLLYIIKKENNEALFKKLTDRYPNLLLCNACINLSSQNLVDALLRVANKNNSDEVLMNDRLFPEDTKFSVKKIKAIATAVLKYKYNVLKNETIIRELDKFKEPPKLNSTLYNFLGYIPLIGAYFRKKMMDTFNKYKIQHEIYKKIVVDMPQPSIQPATTSTKTTSALASATNGLPIRPSLSSITRSESMQPSQSKKHDPSSLDWKEIVDREKNTDEFIKFLKEIESSSGTDHRYEHISPVVGLKGAVTSISYDHNTKQIKFSQTVVTLGDAETKSESIDLETFKNYVKPSSPQLKR